MRIVDLANVCPRESERDSKGPAVCSSCANENRKQFLDKGKDKGLACKRVALTTTPRMEVK